MTRERCGYFIQLILSSWRGDTRVFQLFSKALKPGERPGSKLNFFRTFILREVVNCDYVNLFIKHDSTATVKINIPPRESYARKTQACKNARADFSDAETYLPACSLFAMAFRSAKSSG